MDINGVIVLIIILTLYNIVFYGYINQPEDAQKYQDIYIFKTNTRTIFFLNILLALSVSVSIAVIIMEGLDYIPMFLIPLMSVSMYILMYKKIIYIVDNNYFEYYYLFKNYKIYFSDIEKISKEKDGFTVKCKQLNINWSDYYTGKEKLYKLMVNNKNYYYLKV
jgi:hypothetical protein